MGVFDIDGKFFRGLTKAGDFLILFFLLIVFSIPVITFGTALSAVYYVALKLVRDEEGYVWKDFWKAFKQNVKQGIVMELILAVIGVLLGLDIGICANWAKATGSTPVRLLMFAVMGMLLVWAAVVLYAFPILAKFDNTVFANLKNALLLCTHHLPQTIMMLIANGGLIYITVRYFGVVFVTGPLILYIDSYIFSRILKQYMPKEEKETDED